MPLPHFSDSSFFLFPSFHAGKAPRIQLWTMMATRRASNVRLILTVVATLIFVKISTDRLPREESRSLTDSVLVPSLSVRSGVTKKLLSSLSGSFPFKGSFVKLVRTSRLVTIYHHRYLMILMVPDGYSLSVLCCNGPSGSRWGLYSFSLWGH